MDAENNQSADALHGKLTLTLDGPLRIAALVEGGWLFPILVVPRQLLLDSNVQVTKTTTETEARMPAWLLIIIVALGVIPVLIFFITDIYHRPRRIKEYGSGGVKKVQEWDLDEKSK